MTEHPTKQQLNEYCRRVLAPAAFLPVHRHVITCARCAAQCNSPQQLARDFDQLQEALIVAQDAAPYHLSAAEIKGYTQGTLDEIDLEIAESHLGICATCHSQVEGQAVIAEPVHVNAAASRPRRWALGNASQPMRIAAAVLFGAILILLTIWLLRSRPAVNKQTVGPADTSSPQSSSTAEVKSTSTPEISSNGPSQPQADAEFALLLNDGSRKVTLDTRGALAGLEQLPASIQEKVGAALKTGRLQQSPDLALLASQRSTLLGQSGNGLPFRLIGPLAEVVRTQQPSFRWRALDGAQSYKVIVTDSDLNEVATSPPLDTTAWRITKPLPPGRIYSWQVTALKDGVEITSPVLPAPQAKFKVIDSSTARMLQQAERAYPDSRLTLGVLYAEAGLLEQAEQELTALVRSNPQARIAQQLLQNVRSMRAARN